MGLITDFSNLNPIGKILVIAGIVGIIIIIYFIKKEISGKKEEKKDGNEEIQSSG